MFRRRATKELTRFVIHLESNLFQSQSIHTANKVLSLNLSSCKFEMNAIESRRLHLQYKALLISVRHIRSGTDPRDQAEATSNNDRELSPGGDTALSSLPSFLSSHVYVYVQILIAKESLGMKSERLLQTTKMTRQRAAVGGI